MTARGGGTGEPHSGHDHDVTRCVTSPTADAMITHASSRRTLQPVIAAPMPNSRLNAQNEAISHQYARRGGRASTSSPQAEQ